MLPAMMIIRHYQECQGLFYVGIDIIYYSYTLNTNYFWLINNGYLNIINK